MPTTTKESTVAEKSPYRVVVLAASYVDTEPGFLPDGSQGEVPVYRVADFGQVIDLTEAQVRALADKGPLLNPANPSEGRGPAVKPADEAKSYSEMTVPELEDLATERDLTVTGSGADGRVLKDDLVNALSTYDQGQNAS